MQMGAHPPAADEAPAHAGKGEAESPVESCFGCPGPCTRHDTSPRQQEVISDVQGRAFAGSASRPNFAIGAWRPQAQKLACHRLASSSVVPGVLSYTLEELNVTCTVHLQQLSVRPTQYVVQMCRDNLWLIGYSSAKNAWHAEASRYQAKCRRSGLECESQARICIASPSHSHSHSHSSPGAK